MRSGTTQRLVTVVLLFKYFSLDTCTLDTKGDLPIYFLEGLDPSHLSVPQNFDNRHFEAKKEITMSGSCWH